MSIIETERLILRPFRERDIESVLDLYSNGLSQQTSESHSEICNNVLNEMFLKWINEYNEGLDVRWAITLKECDTIVGDVMVNRIMVVDGVEEAEIGYNIHINFRNRGYATEATKAVIQNLFGRGVLRIVAWHEPDNPASGRVMEKCGLKFTGFGKERKKFGSEELCDVKCYAIDKTDFKKSSKKA